MMITTKSGSEYHYDPDERVVTWTAADGTTREYTCITHTVIIVGYRFVYSGIRDIDGAPNTRITTPVVSIEDDPT